MSSQKDRKYYAGIGSRKTPENILSNMSYAAIALHREGYILRSGRAPGADQAFESGAYALSDRTSSENVAEIYLPWKTFEKDFPSWIEPARFEPQFEAYEIAEKYHPSWKFLSHGAKKLHARNVHQIYGYDVTNPVYSEFVICWTEGKRGGGGTGQALRIAADLEIQIFDLAGEEDIEEVLEKING